MQFIKGAAVSGVAIAALVAGGGAAAPPPALATSSTASLSAVAPASASGATSVSSRSTAASPFAPGLAAAGRPSAEAASVGSRVGASPPRGSRLAAGPALAGAASVGSPSVDPPAAGPPSLGSPALSRSLGARTGPPATCRPAPPPRHRQWLDGFLIGWVPPGIGPMVTDFEYEWEDVGFRSRVWESGPYPDESYRVDLQVTVMRSPTFTDESALREFLVEYLERDPAAWATRAFAHPDGPGFADVGELFWLAAPGVAVRVFGGGEQLDFRDLTRTACAVRQVVPMD